MHQRRIVSQHDTPAALYRHLADVFTRRATEQLRDGRDPEQASFFAATYAARAKQLEGEAVTR